MKVNFTLQMKTVHFSKTQVSKHKFTWRYYPADQHRQLLPRSPFLSDIPFLALVSPYGMPTFDTVALHDLGVSVLAPIPKTCTELPLIEAGSANTDLRRHQYKREPPSIAGAVD
jgi:hypothetical protein